LRIENVILLQKICGYLEYNHTKIPSSHQILLVGSPSTT